MHLHITFNQSPQKFCTFDDEVFVIYADTLVDFAIIRQA